MSHAARTAGAVTAFAACAVVLLGGCAHGSAAAANGVQTPPVAARFSYQIGGAYRPPAGTRIVDRDHDAAPAQGIYSICYVNAFQAQPEQTDWWLQHHPALLLRDRSGELVLDQQWHEPLFDVSTQAARAQLIAVVGGWLDSCATRGYRGVEADNLDSYTRSRNELSAADALAFARLLIDRAHHDRLAIGQKNAAGLSSQGRRAGFDFAIAEECQRYDECDSYRHAYGDHVIEIEYSDNPRAAFTAACARRGRQISVTFRDRDVTPAGDPAHVERWCS